MQTTTSPRSALAELRASRRPVAVSVAGAGEPGTTSDDGLVSQGAARHAAQRSGYWDGVARLRDRWEGWGGAYHARLREVYRHLVTPGQRILELGCGRGDLLASLAPSAGVGVDLSPEMVNRAAERHARVEGLTFVAADAHDLQGGAVGGIEGPFDVVILSDLVNELWDVQAVLERIGPLCTSRTRIIINTYSKLWDWPLAVVDRLGLARPLLRQNWLTVHDLENLLALAGFEPLRSWQEVLWPLRTPILGRLLNRYGSKIWPTRHLCLANFLVARPRAGVAVQGSNFVVQASSLHDPSAGGNRVPTAQASSILEARPQRPDSSAVQAVHHKTESPYREPIISVIVPARNEAGNIDEIFRRTPEMGAGTELIFVEGHSRDDTLQAIERAMARYPYRRARLLVQKGEGKGDAVRLGFEEASGDVLMILDADLTVSPEQLPRFYEALHSGMGEFINGVRLVYPMEDRAMRPLNLLGNKFFGAAFSWLLGQPLRDTLCGTKVLWTEDYRRIAANRAYFGEFDPFGDFDLIFGAAKLNLKIVDVPVRYGERTYGTTNIRRFRHGWMLMKMVAFAAGRIKFV